MELQCSTRIAGIGGYLPKTRVTSESIMAEINAKRFDIAEDFMTTQFGIKERRVADDHMMPSDLAIFASQQAIADAGVQPEEVGMVLYCGIERDWQEPATSHRVQAELGCVNAPCLDITNASHGFMHGLSLADAYIGSSGVDNILVCTGERYKEMTDRVTERLKKTSSAKDFTDGVSLLTVGDSGGAMIVQRKLDDSGWKLMKFSSREQLDELDEYKDSAGGIIGQMLIDQTRMQVVEDHQHIIAQTYAELGWQASVVDYFYTYQAGVMPYQMTCDLSGIPREKAPTVFELFGNLTTATLPVTMSLNRPNRGDKVLVLGAGSRISICQAGMVF